MEEGCVNRIGCAEITLGLEVGSSPAFERGRSGVLLFDMAVDVEVGISD